MGGLFGNLGETLLGSEEVAGSSSSTQMTHLPDWLKKGGENVRKEYESLINRPYPTYDGPRVAEFSDLQNKAFDLLRSRETPDYSRPEELAWEGSQPITEADYGYIYDQYYDPLYRRQELDMSRQQAKALQELRAKAAASGAFYGGGGTEFFNKAAQPQTLSFMDALAGAKAQSLQQALLQAQANKDRQLKGSQALANVISQEFNASQGQAQSLLAGGGIQQGRDQMQMDIDYEDFMREFEYPQTQQERYLNILNSIPYEQITTGSAQSNVKQSDNLGIMQLGEMIFGSGLASASPFFKSGVMGGAPSSAAGAAAAGAPSGFGNAGAAGAGGAGSGAAAGGGASILSDVFSFLPMLFAL